MYYDEKKEKVIFFTILGLIVVAIISFFTFFNVQTKKLEAKLDDSNILYTFAENQKMEAQKEKHKKNPSIQDIAYQQMQKAAGLKQDNTKFKHYGINTDNEFIQYGILTGDGIPYASSKANDFSGKFTEFDPNDDKYWEDVNSKNFDKIKSQINSEIPILNSEKSQKKQIQKDIEKAQQDDIMNMDKIKEEHDKSLKPKDIE